MSVKDVTVYVPVLDAPLKIMYNGNLAIQDIIDNTAKECKLKNPSLASEFDLYGIFLIEGKYSDANVENHKQPLRPERLLSSIEFKKTTALLYDKLYFRVQLSLKSRVQYVTLEGFKTVKTVLRELFPHDEGYELKLHPQATSGSMTPSVASSAAIRMDEDRTISSYRLKEGDKIVVTNKVTQTGIWRSVGGQQMAVIIRCPNNGVTKTIKFNPSITMYEIKLFFIQKVNLYVAPRLYGIYIEFTPEITEDDLVKNESQTLESFPLPTPVRLTCKALPRQPIKLFGVDPSTLPMVNDMGYEVPEVLAILRELLQSKNGLVSEGIFRKAGSELEMKVLRQQMENGENIVCDNIHSVATMLKRWFKELPQRILAHIDIKTLVDTNQKLSVFSSLSPLSSSMLNWLLAVLLIPVKSIDTTLMDPKNIAIVWGPIMIGSNNPGKASLTDDFAQGFEDTKYGIDIVESLISHFLNTQTNPPTNGYPSSSLSTTNNNNNSVNFDNNNYNNNNNNYNNGNGSNSPNYNASRGAVSNSAISPSQRRMSAIPRMQGPGTPPPSLASTSPLRGAPRGRVSVNFNHSNNPHNNPSGNTFAPTPPRRIVPPSYSSNSP